TGLFHVAYKSSTPGKSKQKCPYFQRVYDVFYSLIRLSSESETI
ncbi:8686_t:CDS:2, partial [Funneliformis caledonium]